MNTIKVTRRSDGRFCATIRIDGKKLFAYGKTESDVRARVRELQSRKQKGQLRPPSHLTLNEWFDFWLQTMQSLLKATTYESYDELLRLHVRPHLGTVKVEKVTPSMVAGLVAKLLDGKRSPRRVEMAFAVLRKSLNDACRLDIVGANPCAKVDPPKVEHIEQAVWTLDEVRQFIADQDAKPHRSSALWVFLIATGLRIGEAIGLHWSDLSLDDATVTVRQNVAYIKRVPVVQTPKTASSKRTISLPTIAMKALREQKRVQAAERLKAGPDWIESDHVFTSANGGYPSHSSLRAQFETCCRRAGACRMHIHALRHAHATLLAASGAPVKDLQRRMGHSSLSTTMNHYVHAVNGADRALAATIDRLTAG